MSFNQPLHFHPVFQDRTQAEWQTRFPNLKKKGRELKGPCPACGEGDDRLRVLPNGKVFCRICAPSGTGNGYKRIMEIAWGDSQPAVAEYRPSVDSRDDRERQRKIDLAGKIWSRTKPADDTPARVYLSNRLAWPPLGTGPDLPVDCRWLARENAPPRDPAIDWYQLPQPANGAMVCAFRTRTGDLKAVSLEALDRDGYLLPKRWRRTFGEKIGATFNAGGDGSTLVLVEGEVSGLAARWLHPAGRVLATGGDAGLKKFRPGPADRQILIAADNDGPGRVAAGALADTLRADGRVCNIAPGTAGDPADDLEDAMAERISIKTDNGLSETDATISAWTDRMGN